MKPKNPTLFSFHLLTPVTLALPPPSSSSPLPPTQLTLSLSQFHLHISPLLQARQRHKVLAHVLLYETPSASGFWKIPLHRLPRAFFIVVKWLKSWPNSFQSIQFQQSKFTCSIILILVQFTVTLFIIFR